MTVSSPVSESIAQPVACMCGGMTGCARTMSTLWRTGVVRLAKRVTGRSWWGAPRWGGEGVWKLLVHRSGSCVGVRGFAAKGLFGS